MRRVHPIDAFRDRVLARVRPDLAAELVWRDERSARVVAAFLRPGDVVIDIGASGGTHSYPYARLVGARGHVHAFEPHPANAPELRRLARLPQVTLHPVALSHAPGEAELRSPIVAGRTLRALASFDRPAVAGRRAYEVVTVEVRRLDDVLPADVAPSWIKCDVEGHEHDVLLGARQTIARARPVMLVEVEQRHRVRPIADTFDLVESWGYRTYAVCDGALVPRAAVDLERVGRAGAAEPLAESLAGGYVNEFLFVPAERSLPAELAGAARTHHAPLAA